MMHASSRGGSSFALVEPLERRELLSFDPAKVGAINAGSHSWKAQPGAADYFLENHRIGYMIASLDSTLERTSYAKGGDPWPYVSGGRYQFKNGGGVPIGTLTLRNVQSTHVTVERYWAHDWDSSGIRTGQKGKWNGVHTDGIYIENTEGHDPTSIFVFENVEMTEISGGQGILWEKGSARRIHFKHVHVENRKTSISGRIMLKVDEDNRFDEIIFDDVTANVIFMVDNVRLSNALGRVYVHDLSASQRDAIRAELERHDFPVDDPTRFVTSLPDDLVDANGVALARPYRGAPVSVGWTTTVQAEEYDNGQEGLAYHDTTADAGGAIFRSSAKRNADAVDILPTKGGHAVRMVAGEWMDYTIDVRAGGVYNVRALVPGKSSGKYRIEFDGIQSTGNLPVGEGESISLPAGQHVMRLIAVAGTFDVDGIDLARHGKQIAVAAPTDLSAKSMGWGALDTSDWGARRTFAGVTKIAWNDVDGEREYLIDRRTPDGKWRRVGSAAADVTSFSDAGQWAAKGERSGIEPSTVYEYRVVAVDDGGQRHASKLVRVRTGAPTLTAPPRAPLLLAVKVRASGALQVEWADRSHDERGFRIERSTDPLFGASEILDDDDGANHLSYDLPPVGTDVTEYVDRGGELTDRTENQVHALRPGQTYYYRVRAYNSMGQSSPSEVLSVTTPDVAAPQPARTVSAAADRSGCGAVVVAWKPPESGEAISGYRVERKRESGGTSWYVLGIVEGAATEFTDVALRTSNMIDYQYRVVAFNVAGDAQPSEIATTRVPKSAIVSKAPAKLRAAASSATTMSLEWLDRSSNEAGFRIERSTDRSNWMLVGSVGADRETFEDTGLLPRTTYHYRVTAFNTNDTDSVTASPSALARGKTPALNDHLPPGGSKSVAR